MRVTVDDVAKKLKFKRYLTVFNNTAEDETCLMFLLNLILKIALLKLHKLKETTVFAYF